MCLMCFTRRWRVWHIQGMSELMSEDAKRTVRVPLLLTPEEAAELDDWQFSNRLRTRSDALREMMRRAIQTDRETKR